MRAGHAQFVGHLQHQVTIATAGGVDLGQRAGFQRLDLTPQHAGRGQRLPRPLLGIAHVFDTTGPNPTTRTNRHRTTRTTDLVRA